MKRSQQINLDRMRKVKTSRPLLRPLALAVASITLAACSDQEEQVKVVTSVDDCTDNTSLTREQCEVAYKQAIVEAVRTGPRYDSQSQCEAEFGYNQCIQPQPGSFFMPFIAGFMVSNLLNGGNYGYNPVYYYRNSSSSYRNRLMTADGSVIGRPGQSTYSVSKSALQPKPSVTRTVSRGGFGSTASAKSSWGGGKYSGWGG